MARALLTIASIALTVFALADCVQADGKRVQGVPKWAWILLIVLIPWIGPLTWLLVGKDRSGSDPERPDDARRRPLAPDDDPDFLRKLDEDIRRERRERDQERERPDGDDNPSSP